MPCLVKDLTCVPSALPNSMMHVLVLVLTSRAKRRFHQPCSISPLLRPARRPCRSQEHASGCMQAPFLQELITFEQRGEVCPAFQTCTQFVPGNFLPHCPSIEEARKACQKPQPSIATRPALRLHLLPSGCLQDVCRMGIQLCCKSVTTTADMCPRTYLQRVVGFLAIIAVAISPRLCQSWA